MKTLEDKDREIKRLSHWLGEISSWQDLNPSCPRIWVISYNREDQTYTLYSDLQDCFNDFLPGIMGYTTVKLVGSKYSEMMKYGSRYYGFLPKLRKTGRELNPGMVFNYWIYGYINPDLNIFSSSHEEDLRKQMRTTHPLGRPEGYTLVEFKITETGKTWKGRQHDDRI